MLGLDRDSLQDFIRVSLSSDSSTIFLGKTLLQVVHAGLVRGRATVGRTAAKARLTRHSTKACHTSLKLLAARATVQFFKASAAFSRVSQHAPPDKLLRVVEIMLAELGHGEPLVERLDILRHFV